MLPGNTLSSTPIITAFLYPKNLQTANFESVDLGGIALNDPSAGLMYQGWKAFFLQDDPDGVVYLGPINGPYSPYINFPGISTISVTFDQNMNPFLAVTQAGIAKFHWWDSLTSSYQTTNLPAGSKYPKASLDDKRQFALGSSDIILSYIRDGNLYYRQQRERYLIEHLLYADLNQDIIDPILTDVGMSVGSRFIFAVSGAFFPV